MYVKQLSENEEKSLMARRDKITNLQDMGVCFSTTQFYHISVRSYIVLQQKIARIDAGFGVLQTPRYNL